MTDSTPGTTADLSSEPVRSQILLQVNHIQRQVVIEPRRTLLSVLRNDLHLTGAKPGCFMGNCGACTVLVDGEAVYSCLTLAIECEGREITTIEGLLIDGELDRIQKAFIEYDAVQCGFCTPGQILSVKALLAASERPELDTIKRSLSGNICRCGTYPKILAAVTALCQQPPD